MKMAIDKVMAALAEELTVENAQKAAMTLSDFNAGSLSKEAADAFIDQVVDESVLLGAVRVHRTDSPSGDLSKLTITGPVTQKATEGTAYTNTKKPSNSVVTYNTAKSVSAIDISGEVQEDTIEGQGARGTVMGAMVNQIANDMEMLSIEGDDSLGGATDTEKLLMTNDGWLVKLDDTSDATQIDCAGAAPSMELLIEMIKNMPTKWRRDLGALRFIMSGNSAIGIQKQLGGYGNVHYAQGGVAEDVRSRGGLPPTLHGVPPLVVPLMPEDLTIDGTAGNTGATILLINPQNLIYVVQRELTVEWERVPRSDTDEGTVHMRTDFIVEEAAACVRANNVNLAAGATMYGNS